MEKRRLGRGLDALLGIAEGGTDTAVATEQAQVPLDRIQHNPFQPRKTFDADELASLCDSVRSHGILQPLVVRPVGDHYQLVAGERRLRAAQAAGFTEVPIRVVDFDDQQTLEAALAENINRADLNPIEKARGFKDYLAQFGTTQEQLANRLGVDRTTISNLVNLLDLPSEVQEAVRLGQIQVGHAKAIKGLGDPKSQVAMCKEIIASGYNVRMAETLVKDEKTESAHSPAKTHPKKTAHVQSIEDDLRQRLATRVEIRLRERHKGQIVLGFESNDDFERLIDVLRGE